jgi:hypothetical protein
MTEFDPIKALREELAGLASVQAVITKRETPPRKRWGLPKWN